MMTYAQFPSTLTFKEDSRAGKIQPGEALNMLNQVTSLNNENRTYPVCVSISFTYCIFRMML